MTELAGSSLQGRFGLPLASVIITNHNYGRYLTDAVESVFSQTYPMTECIVVDDASTDESGEVIKALKERFPALKTVMRRTNAGQCTAFRDGFHESSGEYVVFLDADDFLLPEFVETHIFVHLSLLWPVGMTSCDTIQSTNNRVVTGTFSALNNCGRIGSGEKGNFFRRIDRSLPGLWTLRGVSGEIENDVHFSASINPGSGFDFRVWKWAPTSGNCFRREVVALFLNSRHLHVYRYAADSYLVRAINMLTGSVIIDRRLVVYRIHGGNVFANHPEIVGLKSYDTEQLAQEDRITWRMTLDHLIDNAEVFANKLPSRAHFAAALEALWVACEDDSFGDECRTHIIDMVSKNASTLLSCMGRRLFATFIVRIGVDQEKLSLLIEEKTAIDREIARTLASRQTGDSWCRMVPLSARTPIAKLMCRAGRLFHSSALQRTGAKLWNLRYCDK